MPRPSDYLQKQREYRAANGNQVTKRYEKTKPGKIMRTYRNMQSRVLGLVVNKRHLYSGKDILSREDFYAWALGSADFDTLYAAWVEGGYSAKLSPSVDRIDPAKGYTLDNMRWLTHSENSRRSSRAVSRQVHGET